MNFGEYLKTQRDDRGHFATEKVRPGTGRETGPGQVEIRSPKSG